MVSFFSDFTCFKTFTLRTSESVHIARCCATCTFEAVCCCEFAQPARCRFKSCGKMYYSVISCGTIHGMDKVQNAEDDSLSQRDRNNLTIDCGKLICHRQNADSPSCRCTNPSMGIQLRTSPYSTRSLSSVDNSRSLRLQDFSHEIRGRIHEKRENSHYKHSTVKTLTEANDFY